MSDFGFPRQLGRARVRKIWLLSRRVIALAELSGLSRSTQAKAIPRVSTVKISSQEQDAELFNRRKAEVWKSICAVDRMTSMMWSLPLATRDYPLPKRPIINSRGQIDHQSYLFSLADVASRILELDNMYTSGDPLPRLSAAVSEVHDELQSLQCPIPRDSQRVPDSAILIETLLRYWHQYLLLRTHLQLALAHNERQEFIHSFQACLNASQELAHRYTSIRPTLPGGFFANRVIDLQNFTAIVFLLLVSHQSGDTDTRGGAGKVNLEINAIIDQGLSAMILAADRTGGDFVRQAVEVVRALRQLLQQAHTGRSQEIQLNLPLVGRIHVSHKPRAATTAQTRSDTFEKPHQVLNSGKPQKASLAGTEGRENLANCSTPPVMETMDSIDTFTYLMEIPDNYPILFDEMLETQDWLTCTNSPGSFGAS